LERRRRLQAARNNYIRSNLCHAQKAMSSLLQVIAGTAIVFFVPGYVLVTMLFPRRGELDPEYDVVYRLALGMGLSIVISILVGFALNAISSEEQGYVSAGPLWVALLSLTAVFVVGGWYRGAYPSLGALHPSLYRPTRPRTVAGTSLSRARDTRHEGRLVGERELLLVEVDDLLAKSSSSNPRRKLYYRRRMDRARERIEEINAELDRIRNGGP
jgi:hypothetical protein